MKIMIMGGAGFVGSNLINLLLKKTKKKIVSFDNYSTGTVKNHVNDKRVIYIKGNTTEIEVDVQIDGQLEGENNFETGFQGSSGFFELF